MNRIREARKQAGIKQTDLCARLGISQGALSGWENGKYEPGRSGWLSLSEVLGVSVDYLMGSDAPAVLPAPALSADEIRLLAAYRELSQQGKEYILQTLDMAEKVYKKPDPVSNLEEKLG